MRMAPGKRAEDRTSVLKPVLKIYYGDAMYSLILRRRLPLVAVLAASLNLCFSQSSPTAVTVVSAADYRSYVSPQAQASAFGANLADATAPEQLDAAGQLSTELAGTTVQVCGEAAGLIFVAPSQINFVVPADLGPGTCPVVVTTNGRTSTGTADIRPVSPAFFTMDGSGSGRAAALPCNPLTAGGALACAARVLRVQWVVSWRAARAPGARAPIEIHDGYRAWPW